MILETAQIIDVSIVVVSALAAILVYLGGISAAQKASADLRKQQKEQLVRNLLSAFLITSKTNATNLKILARHIINLQQGHPADIFNEHLAYVPLVELRSLVLQAGHLVDLNKLTELLVFQHEAEAISLYQSEWLKVKEKYDSEYHRQKAQGITLGMHDLKDWPEFQKMKSLAMQAQMRCTNADGMVTVDLIEGIRNAA